MAIVFPPRTMRIMLLQTIRCQAHDISDVMAGLVPAIPIRKALRP